MSESTIGAIRGTVLGVLLGSVIALVGTVKDLRKRVEVLEKNQKAESGK